jgi:hypothetical protein
MVFSLAILKGLPKFEAYFTPIPLVKTWDFII